MKSSTAIVLGLLGAAVLGGAAFLVLRGGSKQVNVQQPPGAGYTVLPDCAGVTVTNEAAAKAFASNLGSNAEKFTPATSTTWVVKAMGALGIPLTCNLKLIPQDAIVFAYGLFQSYVRGARKVEQITEPEALTVVSYIRNQFLTSGIDAAKLPEGLGV